jgi:hypothetical protein
MKVFGIAAWIALTGCNVTDDRPETLAYITEAILAPSCGTATCHSAMKREYGYAFDSVAEAQKSIQSHALILTCGDPPCAGAAANSPLLTFLWKNDSQGNRMPIDAPLANADIDLIGRWIDDGAFGYQPLAAPQ